MKPITRHPMFHSQSYPGTETLTAEQLRLVEEMNRRLATGEMKMETVPCLCGGTDFDLIARYDRYRIAQDTVVCRRCGLMQSQPRMAADTLPEFYGSDAYRELYGGARLLPHTPDRFEKQARANARRKAAIEAHLDLASITKVVEVGCGAGWNLWSFHQAGKQVVGCDYSPALTAAGREAGMDIRQGTADVALAGETADLLILSHVVEHFPDPIGEVQRIVAQLKPRHVYIEVPNVDCFSLGTLQSAHMYTFSPATLIDAMAQAGLAAQVTIPLAPHFAVLFQVGDNGPRPDLSGEHARVVAIVRRYEWRQRIRGWVESLGLLAAARRLLAVLR